MKKIISIVLCAVLLMATTNIAYAIDYTDNTNESLLKEYTAVDDTGGIYTDASGQFVYLDTDSDNGPVLIPMERTTFSPSARTLNDSKATNLPQEVKDGLDAALQAAQSSGAVVSLFSPEESTSRSSSEWTYGTYNGVSMKNYLITTTGGSTSYKTVKSGTTAADVADFMKSIFLEATGITQTSLPFLTTAISLLDAYESAFSNEVVVSSSDYLQLNLSYNSVVKYTYAQYGSVWKFGLQSMQVTVTKVYVCQYYKNVSTTPYHTNYTVNKTVSSANFASPYPTAYSCAMAETPRTENAKWTPYYVKNNVTYKLSTFVFA